MALVHVDSLAVRDNCFPVSFAPLTHGMMDSIQSLYQIQQISASIAELAKAAQLNVTDPNYVMRARTEIAQLSSILNSLSSPVGVVEMRSPKAEPKETPPTIEAASNKRKHRSISCGNQYCRSCGTTQTPEWRRGPDGGKSLCNACGLHYAKIVKREVMVPARKTETASEAMSLRSLLN